MNAPRWALALLGVLECSCTGSLSDTSKDAKPTTDPRACDQRCQDDEVGFAIDDTVWLIWNEYFAGHPSGAQTVAANCPLGGTAQISGNTGVASNGINTVQLSFVLRDCENSDTYYSLGFTGEMTWNGTFSSGAANAITFKSNALTIRGSVNRYDNPSILETCPVSLTDTFEKNASDRGAWLNGEICGRPVNL